MWANGQAGFGVYISKDIEARIAALPVRKGSMTIAPLHGGLSNENWRMTDEGGDYVVRFGVDYPFHHVFRDREAMTARAAHAAGFGPQVIYSGPGVLVSCFIDASTLDPAGVRTNAERIAKLLRDFHRRMPAFVSGPGFAFWPFHVIRDYAARLIAQDSPFADSLEGLLARSQILEAAQIPMPIAFGHHDLLPANFLDDGRRLWLVDFEYAGFGTAMFDLAGVTSNAAFGPAETDAFLAAYFGADARQYRTPCRAMQAASLLREALWGMVSALHLNVPGVDYEVYARDNLAKFEKAFVEFENER